MLSAEDQRHQVRRSLRVRRGAGPSYEERSESGPDEPSSAAHNWPARSRGKHRPAPEAQPQEKLAPPPPVNLQAEPKEDGEMPSWAAVGLRTQTFRQRGPRFDPLRCMGNTSEPPFLFLFCMLIPRHCVTSLTYYFRHCWLFTR